MSDTAVRFDNVTKIYKLYDSPKDRFKETFSIRKKRYSKDFYALNDVSFTINRGETVGIVGKNGSGKSTLLKMLTGVLSQTAGTIGVSGKISALLELGAGFNMEFTGMENIYLNGTILNISKEEMDKRLDSIISFADIGEFIHQPVKTYSSGMFVRLAFSVAIHVDPEILIVDEALAVGDTRFQMKCMDKFVEFMNAGKTVIIVSHDLNMIKRFCKRAIWLNDGALVMDGDVDTVTDIYNDFLKSGLTFDEYSKSLQVEKNGTEEGNIGKDDAEESSASGYGRDAGIDKNAIAEVSRVRLFDKVGNEISDVPFGEDITLEIDYEVFEENVAHPVLGVAIRSVDHKYICGLNTLLDDKKIPWVKGHNVCRLTYERFNLTGGGYYFDVALFDKTATVNFDYQTQIKRFFVKMDYIAEGITVLHHEWKV